MNTFLTDFDIGGGHISPIKRKVNFTRPHTNLNNNRKRLADNKENFTTPYVDFYISGMDHMDKQLNRKLQRLVSKSFDLKNKGNRAGAATASISLN
jgi:hypothetical protein